MEEKKDLLDISWGTILKIGIAFFCFYLIYLIKDILSWLVFALIISVLFDPAIDFLQKRKVPRVLSVISVYISIFGILGLVIYLVSHSFSQEIQQIGRLLPEYFGKIAPFLNKLGITVFDNTFTGALEEWFVRASTNIFTAISAVFGGILSAFTIFALAIFLSIEEKGVEKVVGLLSPKKHEAHILELWKKSQIKISRWFGTRIILGIFVGVCTSIVCYILDIKYAISFGLIAGILDIIPIIGPIVAGVIIVIFSALDSWIKALFILVIFILIQQIEGNILTPILTKKFIGLPAVLVLVALIVGAKLWGVLGAILTIPLFGLVYEFLKDFLKKKKGI